MLFQKDKECPTCHRKWQKDKVWQIVYIIFVALVLYVALTCPSALKGSTCCPCLNTGMLNNTLNLTLPLVV